MEARTNKYSIMFVYTIELAPELILIQKTSFEWFIQTALGAT